MDILSLIGILVGFTAILLGNALEGGHLDSLLQLTAFLIVMGGSFGAVLLQTPMPIFKLALKRLGWVFVPPKSDPEQRIQQIMEWSHTARRDGLLGLESLIEQQSDPFVAKGLQLLVDGSEPEAIRRMLEVDLETQEHVEMSAAKVFESLGGYAPTIGIIGAVLGLIHVMNNLADPSKLGPGIAVAFVATIYGVGSANLLFLPTAHKLKALIHDQVREREMLIEAFASISEGENPRAIETKLRGFLYG
jgi:Flagellar motor component